MDTLSRTLTISNDLGLHARAAAKIARVAEKAGSAVYLVKDGQQADATNILDILNLYCPRGTELIVKIVDPNDAGALGHIAELIEDGFGEPRANE